MILALDVANILFEAEVDAYNGVAISATFKDTSDGGVVPLTPKDLRAIAEWASSAYNCIDEDEV